MSISDVLRAKRVGRSHEQDSGDRLLEDFKFSNCAGESIRRHTGAKPITKRFANVVAVEG